MWQDGAVHVPGHGAAAAVPLHAVRVRGVVPAAAALVPAGAALRHRHTLPHHCRVWAMETHGGGYNRNSKISFSPRPRKIETLKFTQQFLIRDESLDLDKCPNFG